MTHTKESLKRGGYDGLCNPAEQCGCGLDDLRPCNVPPAEDICEPAYRWYCRNCIEQDGCEFYPPSPEVVLGCYMPVPQEEVIESVSDRCRRTRESNCGMCDDLTCGDNQSNKKEQK